MMRLLKYTVVLLGMLLCGALLLGYLLRGTLLDYAAQNGVRYAGAQGVRISYSSLAPHGIGAEIRGLNVWITKAFLGLTIDRVTATTAFGAALLRGSPDAFLDGEMYGGTFKGATTVSGATTSGNFEMTGVELSKHPQLAGLGIRDGKLDVRVSKFELLADRISALSGHIELSDLETLPPVLPLPIKVPAISDGSVEFDVESDGRASLIKNLQFESNLGSVKGELRSTHDPANGQIRSANGQLNVTLREAGLTVIGPYLPLVSNNKLLATDADFHLSLSVSKCQSPQPLFGNLCVNAAYNPRR